MIPGAMLKLSHIFKSRNKLFQKPLGEDVKNSFRFVSNAGISSTRKSSAAEGKLSGRVFADYKIFKGKASLSASPVLPTFSKLDSGDLKMDRRGVIMLAFLPAIGERKYDYQKRQVFALSATEVGSFLSLGPQDSCEFLHDPAMLSSNSGQVRKSLSIRAHADGTGYLISLNVVNNILNTNERFTVPVTTAEFAVMRASFSFALPHIMGWVRSTNHLSGSVEEDASKGLPQSMSSEWDR